MLILKQSGERQFPNDVMFGPACLSRQRESESRNPRWLCQFPGGEAWDAPGAAGFSTISTEAAPVMSPTR